ncbi:MAG TPA: hypothetical protein VHK91_07725 [Flavisolibacter sp.]|jgi:hypothetical protein|nr:hypothetical protein [Flavisolibacter sp.]
MKRKLIGYALLLTGAMLWMQQGSAQQKKETTTSSKYGGFNVTSTSTDGKGDMYIQYTEDGHRYRIRLQDSKIVELFHDDEKVPETDFPKYEAMVKKILVQVEKDRQQAEKDRAQAELDREQASKDRLQAEKDRAQAEKDRQQAQLDREHSDKDRLQAQKDREQAERDRTQAEKDRQQAVKDRARAEIDRKQAEEDRKLLNSLMDDLVSDKLADSRDAVSSVELNEQTLRVNGKELPADIHKRYQNKYLKNKQQLEYRHTGTNTTISFN